MNSIDLTEEFRNFKSKKDKSEITTYSHFDFFLNQCKKYRDFIKDKCNQEVEIKISDKTNLVVTTNRLVNNETVRYSQDERI